MKLLTFEGDGKFAGMLVVDSFLDDDEKTLADNATLGANCCKNKLIINIIFFIINDRSMCGMRIPKKHKEEGKNGKNSAMSTPKTKVKLTLKKIVHSIALISAIIIYLIYVQSVFSIDFIKTGSNII